MSTRPETLPARPAKRHDIQGLRAVAVLLVVADHAFGWPAGGFIGVDVFFVLSGFLMTSVLYREYQNDGTIRFLAFYRRRIRRLIPAATVTIVVALAASFALFGSGRFISTAWDALTAFLFVSNWRFASQQTDYFAQGEATSPLQHFWSLSVEEQFYLFWPLLLLAILVLVHRTTIRRALALIFVSVVTLALFALSLVQTSGDPGVAYFITPARVWELALGGAVALAMPYSERVASGLRPWLMGLGVAGILLAAAITPNGAGFPAPWAAVAAVATAVVLAFPWNPVDRTWTPLTNPIAQFVGNISYSLYLWHFPAIILITELFRGLPGDGTAVPAALAVVISFGLASLSFRFVEEPVRRSRWLEPGTIGPAITGGRGRVVAMSLAVAITVTTVGAALVVDRLPPAQASGTADIQPGGDPDTTAGTGGSGADQPATTDATAAVEALQAALTGAADASAWPDDLSPSVDSVASSYTWPDQLLSCGGLTYPGVDACTWGEKTAAITIAVVGDSTASSYIPALQAIAEGSDGKYRVVALGMFSCSFLGIKTELPSPEKTEACVARKQEQVQLITAMRPSLLVVSNAYQASVSAETKKNLDNAGRTKALEDILGEVSGAADRIAILAGPPIDKNLRNCYSVRAAPAACESKVRAGWRQIQKSDAEAAAAVGATWVDTRALFCTPDGSCPAFADGLVTKFDQYHMTTEYSRRIGPALQSLLDAAGALGP